LSIKTSKNGEAKWVPNIKAKLKIENFIYLEFLLLEKYFLKEIGFEIKLFESGIRTRKYVLNSLAIAANKNIKKNPKKIKLLKKEFKIKPAKINAKS
jgi:hypothetical protein